MNKGTKNSISFDSSFVKHINERLDFGEIVKKMSKNLLSKKLVTTDYPRAVKDREIKFPTGLPTEPVGVAIPHTDPKYVVDNAVSVAVLKYPIEMTVMGTTTNKVSVSIIFLLSLAQSNKQLNILKRIMSVVQNQSLLKSFSTESDEEITQQVEKAILEEI
ncbi:PTS sugar transporter subunit IIA [Pediococcus siamensis]|uniref:PTS sugar transporter subunit IIA n=1 Tax=Pediococcus siamensis TaxID=381829 RepID=UPI0039A16D8B